MKRFLLLTSVAVAALSSCNVAVDPEVSVSEKRFAVGYEGGTFQTVVSCNTDWYASSNTDGVVISPAEGVDGDTLTVTVPMTDQILTRHVEVYVTAYANDTDDDVTCYVTQDPLPFVSCADGIQTVGPDGGRVYFLVNSNMPWRVTSATCDGVFWDADIDPVIWDVNEVEVYVTVPANDGRESRFYEIVLSLEDYPLCSAALRISQSGR